MIFQIQFHDLFFKNFEGYFSLYVKLTFSNDKKKTIDVRMLEMHKKKKRKNNVEVKNFQILLFYEIKNDDKEMKPESIELQ